MAIITRQITGPIETPEHLAVATGLMRVALLHPISDDDTLILPFKLEYNITNGALPASCRLATPGKYGFRIYDYAEERVWSFQVDVFPNSGSSISVAELWLLSKLDGDDAGDIDLTGIDAAILGSDGAADGFVLTADGSGGAAWEATASSTVALYGDVFLVNQVYYLVQDKTHLIVTEEDDVEIRLPDPASENGRIIRVKKASSDGHTVSITSEEDALIDGQLSYPLVYQYEAITLVAANDEWLIF